LDFNFVVQLENTKQQLKVDIDNIYTADEEAAPTVAARVSLSDCERNIILKKNFIW
jgi:hypothetical protein